MATIQQHPAQSQLNLPLEKIRNVFRLAREILKGLRRTDLNETDLRIALITLEQSYCLGREAAIFQRHQDIADLDGAMQVKQVTKAIGRLKRVRILTVDGEVYSFNPPNQWGGPSRAKEGRQRRQAELESRFENLAQQLDLRLFELDAALKEQFVTAGQGVSQTPQGVSETPHVALYGVSQTPQQPDLTNVRSRGVRLLRRTSDAQEAARNLKVALQYIAQDGPAALAKEQDNPIFRRFADLADWPNPLVQAVKDCSDSTVGTQTTHTRRLMDRLKRNVGIQRWLELFPKSKASWDVS